MAAGAANALDFGVGVAADRFLLGESWGSAVAGNALGFGIGQVAGYGLRGVARGGRDC